VCERPPDAFDDGSGAGAGAEDGAGAGLWVEADEVDDDAADPECADGPAPALKELLEEYDAPFVLVLLLELLLLLSPFDMRSAVDNKVSTPGRGCR